MSGLINAGYAGKVPTLFWAVLVITLFGFAFVSAYKRRHDPNKRVPANELVGLAFIMCFMVGIALWEIWKHS